MALGLQDRSYNNFIDESIYAVGLKLQSVLKTSEGTKMVTKEIELTKCDNVYMPVLTNFFQKLDLSNLYCIKNNSELYIRGTYSVSQWTFLEFIYKKCNNNTLIAEGKEATCSDESVIKDTLDQSYFSFFMTDYSLVPKDYKNPRTLLGKNFFISINSKLNKRIFSFLKTIRFETDDAWLFHHNHSQIFYAYDREMEHFFDIIENDEFLHYYVRNSEYKDVITRSYIKLDQVIAKVVTFGFVIVKIVYFLMFFFERLSYESYVCSFFKDDTKKVGAVQSSLEKHNSQMNTIGLLSYQNLIQINKNSQFYKENNKEHSFILKRSRTISIKKLENQKATPVKGTKKNNSQKEIIQNNIDKSSDGLYEVISNNNNTLSKHGVVIKELENVLKNKKNKTKNNSIINCVDICKFMWCNIDTIYQFKYIRKNYKNIGIFMELVRFLKLYNDVDLIKKLFLTENHYRLIEHDYSFYKNSDITFTHYKSHFKLDSNPNNKLTFSNLIIQSSV